MTDGLKLTGQCMCGAVKFSATAAKPTVGVCHCDMCRRWGSGPFMEVDCQEVNFEGEDAISTIRSSEWAERGFCSKCGSSLFYRIVESNEYQMSAGLLDDTSELQMSLQVFTDVKPAFYEFSNKTEMMTEAEVLAAYAPPPD